VSDENKLRDLVAQVAAAYFSNSHVNPTEIPAVMSQIAGSLGAVKEPSAEDAAAVESEQRKLTPAQIRKSITHDGIVSFEDGKHYKTLKRHLGLKGLTPADYRAKWGLPKDYPMVAPSYSATRSALAKKLGLGQKAGARRAKTGGRRKAAASA